MIRIPKFRTTRGSEGNHSVQSSRIDGVEESQAGAQSVMLLVVTDDGRLLLHLRDDIPGILHPGCWAGFGGRVEGNESIDEALRREVLEETGIALTDAEFLVNEQDLEGDGDMVAVFLARGISLDDIVLQEGAGVGVHSFDDLDALQVSPFVRRAIANNLRPLIDR